MNENDKEDIMKLLWIVGGILVLFIMLWGFVGCAAVETTTEQTVGAGGAIVNTEAPTNGYDFALALIKWAFKWIIGLVAALYVLKGVYDGNFNPFKAKHKDKQ